MKNSKKRLFLLSLIVFTGTLLLSACSKDNTENPEQENPELSEGTASATIEFLDTKEKVQFTGTTNGAIGTGSQDTVMMTFVGTDKPIQFILMMTPIDKGTHTMREDGFKTFGIFLQDTTKSKNYLTAYLVGEDNID